MELRHLRYFVAVADEGHVTRAAEKLGIQQPPLSIQIRALEEELGFQLFQRKPRGVELTEVGRTFYADACAILEQVTEAQARAGRTARGQQGTIAIGFTTSAPINPFVPSVIRAYQQAYPGISMVLDEAGSIDLVDTLHAERIDVAFIRSQAPHKLGLTVYPLLEEPMVAAVPKGHPLAGGKTRKAKGSLPLAALAQEPFILYRRRAGPGSYDAIIGACQGAGFSPMIAQEAPQIVSTLNLVAAGLGISIVPESLRSLKLPGVVYLPLRTTPKLVAPLNLACRTTALSAAARNFVQLVRGAAAKT